jgi:hypothetical protein
MAEYKRWYDHDPLLMEVMELLKNFQDDLKQQAEVFLEKIENHVGKEAIDSFYEKVKPVNGKRWYDYDPVLSKAVELLRVAPENIQRQAAQSFIDSLKEQGITVEMIKQSIE